MPRRSLASYGAKQRTLLQWHMCAVVAVRLWPPIAGEQALQRAALQSELRPTALPRC